MDEDNKDPFSLSEDELVERLENLGIENVRAMDVNERVILFLQLMGEAEAPHVQPVGTSQSAPNAASRGSASSASAPSASSGGRHTDELGLESGNAHEGVDHDHVAAIGSDARQYEEAVASFCSITGTDEESARHLLEALGWDLNAAIAMYMEQEGRYRGQPLDTPPHATLFHSTTSQHIF